MNFDPPLVASPEELEVNHGFRRQIFATSVVSLGCLNAGLTIGWAQTGKIDLLHSTSPTQDPDTRKERINDVLEQSFYSSILAAVFLGFLARFFGRRSALLVASFFSVIMLTMLPLDGDTPAVGWWLSGAIVISGITFGPMLLSEAVHEDTRGKLMSACFFQLNLGVLLALTVGSYLDPTVVWWCLIVLYTIQILLFLLIPESPIFLAWKSNRFRAEGSLFWYSEDNRSIALGQVSMLANYFKNNNKSVAATLKESDVIDALKLFLFEVVLLVVGYWILVEFRMKIYLSANGHMRKKDVDVLITCVQTLASLGIVVFVDSIGRKNLMYFSRIVNPSATLISWTYFSWIWDPEGEDFCWFPVLCAIIYIVSFTIGMTTYLSIFVNEVFPMPIKDIVSTLAGFLVVAIALTPTLCRNILDGYLGFSSDKQVFFTIVEPLGLVWTWLYAQETRGESLLNLRTW